MFVRETFLRELRLEITGTKDRDGSIKYINLDYNDFGDAGLTCTGVTTGCRIHFCEGDITEVVCDDCSGLKNILFSLAPTSSPTESPAPSESLAPTKQPKSQKRERKRRSLVARSMTE